MRGVDSGAAGRARFAAWLTAAHMTTARTADAGMGGAGGIKEQGGMRLVGSRSKDGGMRDARRHS